VCSLALTIGANSNTFIAALGAITIGGFARFIFDAGGSIWYRSG
jgi:hypothetical protein